MKNEFISIQVSYFIGVCEESGVLPSRSVDIDILKEMAAQAYEAKFEFADDAELSEEEIDQLLRDAETETNIHRILRYSEQGLVNFYVNSEGRIEFRYNIKGEYFLNEN